MTTLSKPEVCLNPIEGWNVEQFDGDGGCLVTIFTGPDAEKRARSYENAITCRGLLSQVMGWLDEAVLPSELRTAIGAALGS